MPAPPPFKRILDGQPRRDRRARDARVPGARDRERGRGLGRGSRQPGRPHGDARGLHRPATGARKLPAAGAAGDGRQGHRLRGHPSGLRLPLGARCVRAHVRARRGSTFIGPSPDAIEAMGDKLVGRRARRSRPGVPRVPGSGRIAHAADARDFRAPPRLSRARQGAAPAAAVAACGSCAREADLARALEAAAAEAQAAFGDPSLYVEKFIERARHIEIQVLGDSHGNVVHLGERDCSTQRRHQKLIEEAPSPAIDACLREELAAAAVRLAQACALPGAPEPSSSSSTTIPGAGTSSR